MSQSGQEGITGTDGAQGQQQGNGTGTDSAQGTGNDGSTGADGAQQNSGTTGDSNTTVSRDDFDKLQKQLSAADKRREEAEQELKKIKDADLSELEKTKNSVTELTTQRDEALAEVNKLRLENAFLSANDISWQNSDVALDIARAKGYLDDAVDEKGNVNAKELAKALKKLSEDHKYLVKSSDGGDDDENGKPGSTGAPSGGRSNSSSDEQARKERLNKRLPALGRR